MFVSLKANKKRILAFLVLILVVAAGCFYLRWQDRQEPPPQEILGETNEERLAYLQSFGWQVDPEPSDTREVMIPAEFNDVYLNYNAMQQAQGFNLAPYAGEICTQYKYHVTNYPGEPEVYATLLVYGRLIIGGDLACAEVDGFMHGFAAGSVKYGEATPGPDSGPAASAGPSQSGGGSGESGESPGPESGGTPSPAESAVGESSAPTANENVETGGYVDSGEGAQDAEDAAAPEVETEENAYPTD